jgi:hypothetical protein
MNIPHFPALPITIWPLARQKLWSYPERRFGPASTDLHSILLPRWIKMERRLELPSSVSE